MNSDNNEMNAIISDRNIKQNLLPINLIKFHSSIERKHIEIIERGNSLPDDGQTNNENYVKSCQFKFTCLLKSLSQMKLDMKKCYAILETANLDEDVSTEVLLNNILNIYFSNENFTKDKNENLIQNKKPKSSSNLISEIVLNEKINAENPINFHQNIGAKENQVNIKNDGKKKQSNNESKICGICYEEKTISMFIKSDRIHHEFCKACYLNYVTQKIFSNSILKIKCPDECGLIFSDEDIYFILGEREDLYAKYKKFKQIALINQDPNVIWCVRPECPGYTKGEKGSQKVACPLCNQDLCFLCRNAWHPNLSCEQAMNTEFKKYIDRVEVKECPKCKSKIEKNDGCNHMTCIRCHYQFCWICLGKYGENHYKWFNVCGCPGMQYSKLKIPFQCVLIFKLLKFLALMTICVIGAALAIAVSPIFYVIAAVVLPYSFWYSDHRPSGKIARIFYTIGFTLCVIICFPIELLLSLIPGTCFFVYLLIFGEFDDD